MCSSYVASFWILLLHQPDLRAAILSMFKKASLQHFQLYQAFSVGPISYQAPDAPVLTPSHHWTSFCSLLRAAHPDHVTFTSFNLEGCWLCMLPSPAV